MKLLKITGTGTIRKVASDDKSTIHGLIGTVGDFLREGVLEYCDFDPSGWVYIPNRGRAIFGATREEVLNELK